MSRLTLDEAIKHCLEVAEEEEYSAIMFKQWWQSPCEQCMNQSCCENQSKANDISICEMFKPNILATVPRSLAFSYPHYTFVSAVDITTGFLKVAIFNLSKTSTGDIVQDANPIKILTIETNPFVDKFGFEEEIRYKLREL